MTDRDRWAEQVDESAMRKIEKDKARLLRSRQVLSKRIWRWPSPVRYLDIVVVAKLGWSPETTLATGDWTAYIGMNIYAGDEELMDKIGEFGHPLPERVARALFPDIALPYDPRGAMGQNR